VPVVSGGAERKVEDDNEHEPEKNADTPMRFSLAERGTVNAERLPTGTAN
jgi:hypothetical protein